LRVGLRVTEVIEMPANNFVLVLRKDGPRGTTE